MCSQNRWKKKKKKIVVNIGDSEFGNLVVRWREQDIKDEISCKKMSLIFLLYWKNSPTMSKIFMLVSVKTSFLYPHSCSISFCGLWIYTTPTLLSRNPLINNVTCKINSIMFFKQQQLFQGKQATYKCQLELNEFIATKI